MNDTTKTILIASASGTLGAAITQICSLINNYYSDHRKYTGEQSKVIILRKIQVGEAAVHHIGLTIQMFRKLVNNIQESSKFTSKKALDSLDEFLDSQEKELLKSEDTNSIVNFVSIYFKVQSNFTESAIRDSKTAILDAEAKELASKIDSDPASYVLHIQRLNEIWKEMIEHYNFIIQILETDYKTIVDDLRTLME